MKTNKLYQGLIIIIMCFITFSAFAQQEDANFVGPIAPPPLIQFSGMLVSSESNQYDDDFQPIYFAHIRNKTLMRGTISNINGMFSMVVRAQDTILFNALGYKPNYFIIPDTLVDNRLSVVHIMEVDTFDLPETVIFPYPRPGAFKRDFLQLEVEDDPIAMYEKAFGRAMELDYIPQRTNAPELGATVVISGPITALANFIRDGKNRKMDRYREKLGILDSVKSEQSKLMPQILEKN